MIGAININKKSSLYKGLTPLKISSNTMRKLKKQVIIFFIIHYLLSFKQLFSKQQQIKIKLNNKLKTLNLHVD